MQRKILKYEDTEGVFRSRHSKTMQDVFITYEFVLIVDR